MSQKCCSVAKNEKLLLECTNLHMALSKKVKYTDLENGPWVWASALEGDSKTPVLWKEC